MPIQKGCPINFQEVADLVNANYPEYSAIVATDAKGQPISSLDFPGLSGASLLAMMTSPNVTVRPASIGFFVLQNSSFAGIGAEMASKPFFVADTFDEYTTPTYPGDSGTGSVTDATLHVDAYRLAHPDVFVLGTLFSYYSSIIDNENMSIVQIAGRHL